MRMARTKNKIHACLAFCDRNFFFVRVVEVRISYTVSLYKWIIVYNLVMKRLAIDLASECANSSSICNRLSLT